MSIPETPLSFVFHATVPEYRDEIHIDIDAAFDRFGITERRFDALSKTVGSSVGSAAEFRLAAREALSAASDVTANKRGSEQAMQRATDKLFGLLAPLLAAEVVSGTNEGQLDALASDQVNPLAALGLLFYNAEFRCQTSGAAVFPDDGNVAEAWNMLRSALQRPGAEFARLVPATQALCAHLSRVFVSSLFALAW